MTVTNATRATSPEKKLKDIIDIAEKNQQDEPELSVSEKYWRDKLNGKKGKYAGKQTVDAD